MKRNPIIAVIIVAASLFTVSCSKDEIDITKTDYEVGETYNRKFYYTTSYAGIPYGGCYCMSECGRLSLDIRSGNDAEPPGELMSEIHQYSSSERDMKLKHYLIAEINFTYRGFNNMRYDNTPFILSGQWRIVVGSLEEYIYKGQVYERLVIK